MQSFSDITLAFVQAMNQHDLEKMAALLSDDHVFTGAYGEQAKGRESVLKGWAEYFEAFPDYSFELEEVLLAPNGTMIHGWSTGTSLAAVRTGRTFRVPSVFRIKIKDEKIQHWRIFTDTMLPSEILANRSSTDLPLIEGFGGVFLKAKSPSLLTAWYDEHLDMQFGANTWNTFNWRRHDYPQITGRTEFSFFEEDTSYFHPSDKSCMINFRVRSLQTLLDKLKRSGVQQVGSVETFEYGKFAWILDPEGNKIELWEPNDDALEHYENSNSV